MPVPPAPRITSRQHNIVRRFREVARRSDAGLVLLDGEHLLSDALEAAVPIDVVLADERGAFIARRARDAGATVYDVTTGVVEAASPVRTPSGVVALGHWDPVRAEELFHRQNPLIVGLSGVQDPGNVGSAIRAADGLGATGVLALDDTAHPGGWKALRGAMGSTFRVPIAIGQAAQVLHTARARGVQVVATVPVGGVSIEQCDLRRPTLILLGSEGAGLPPEITASADVCATIPMRPRANSLNVAATAAILLYEARRQRGPEK